VVIPRYCGVQSIWILPPLCRANGQHPVLRKGPFALVQQKEKGKENCSNNYSIK